MKPSVLEKEVSIPVGKTERTSGLLSVPTARPERRAVILAHGAGNNMTNPLLSAFARGFAAAGCPTLRFNFLYAHQKKKSPDSRAPLSKRGRLPTGFSWKRVDSSSIRLWPRANRWVAALRHRCRRTGFCPSKDSSFSDTRFTLQATRKSYATPTFTRSRYQCSSLRDQGSFVRFKKVERRAPNAQRSLGLAHGQWRGPLLQTCPSRLA